MQEKPPLAGACNVLGGLHLPESTLCLGEGESLLDVSWTNAWPKLNDLGGSSGTARACEFGPGRTDGQITQAKEPVAAAFNDSWLLIMHKAANLNIYHINTSLCKRYGRKAAAGCMHLLSWPSAIYEGDEDDCNYSWAVAALLHGMTGVCTSCCVHCCTTSSCLPTCQPVHCRTSP